MLNRLPSCVLVAAACLFSQISVAQLRIGGPNLKTANVHVDRGDMLKGQSTVALGAFRVIFVTTDGTDATANGRTSDGTAGQQAYSAVDGAIRGLTKPLAQKITDEIYADFLAQAKAAGYTIVDSQGLAAKSAGYKALPMTENFTEGRFGRYVVPSGQMSAQLANDDSKEVGRGSSKGVFAGFKAQHQATKKGEAEKGLPEVSVEAGMPVWGVTIVVSFAKFKSSGTSHFLSHAGAGMELGPTINGIDEENMPMATGVQFWTKDSDKKCVNCYKPAQAELRGDIHTKDHIGDVTEIKKDGSWDGEVGYRGGKILIDKADYEKNELSVATQANRMLIESLAKER